MAAPPKAAPLPEAPPPPARCRIGLIGFGTVGRALADAIGREPQAELVAVLVRTPLPAGAPKRADSLDALLALRPDVVVECASQDALRTLGPPALARGACLVASSIGALADEAFRAAMTEAAARGRGRLLIPSGGLAGIDALSAARHMGLDRVTYRGSAPPHAWVVPKGAETLPDGRVRVFAGSASEACIAFPKNANVAAALSLAGLSFARTRVELYSVPGIAGYRHEIEAEGAFGHLRTEVMGNLIDPTERPSKVVVGSLLQTALRATLPVAI